MLALFSGKFATGLFNGVLSGHKVAQRLQMDTFSSLAIELYCLSRKVSLYCNEKKRGIIRIQAVNVKLNGIEVGVKHCKMLINQGKAFTDDSKLVIHGIKMFVDCFKTFTHESGVVIDGIETMLDCLKTGIGRLKILVVTVRTVVDRLDNLG